MSIVIKWFLDSGANIHSAVEGEVTTEELGIPDEEWKNMSEFEKEEVMREVAFETLDWGFREYE